MFFISPILALFHPPFWRSLKEKGMGTATLYILYLTVIAAIVGGFLLFRISPSDVTNFVAPFSQILPEKVVWTPAGLEVNDNRPFPLYYENSLFVDNSVESYPPFGMIDTSVDSVAPDEMEKYFVYITKGYAYVRDDKGGYRIIPLTSKDETGDVSRVEIMLRNVGEPLPAVNVKTFSATKTEDMNFSPTDVKGWIAKLWRWVAVFLIAFGAFTIFTWKFTAAMFYSLIALIVNAILKTGASYGKLFCAATYAMTPLIIIQVLSLFVREISFLAGFWAGLAIVTVYIVTFLLSWRKKEAV